MRIAVCVIVGLLWNISLLAQKMVHSTAKPEVKYTPNTVLFKVKPQFSEQFRRGKGMLSSLSHKGVTIATLNTLFPGAQKPERLTNEHGDTLVDLSGIYKMTFTGKKTVTEVVSILQEFPFFEYVEPEYQEDIEINYMPNDPEAQPGLQQFYLYRHRFIEAWDITQGDTNVVIGVLDTGTEIAHTDLNGNIKRNWLEIPGNGIDDEGDGFVDNFYGWDTGDNDEDPNFDVHGHGVAVQGACAAVADNNFGIAGGGFKCKAMPVKISNSIGALVGGYSGIYYAADHGCKVINLSWGGFGAFSQTNQNVINYAAINRNAAIVASAGNSDMEADFYPASYAHVLSVSGLDTQYVAARNEIIEKRTYSGPGVGVTYSFSVDLSAHTLGMSTAGSNGIALFGGTSFSGPVVAGAMGLVRSYRPELSADQAMELLRVSGSCLDSFPETMDISRFKMGRMLDVYKALTNTYIPSVRLKNVSATSKFGSTIFSGDTVTISLDLQNYLSQANNLSVRMLVLGAGAVLLDSTSSVGFIDSLQTLTNIADKLSLRINPNNIGSSVDIVFLFSDPSKNYYDFQGYKLPINPNYLNIDTNNVSLTVFGTGNIGYNDDYFRNLGSGYKLNNAASMLYSGGLMIGQSTTKVSDCVRGGTFTGNQDFKKTRSIRYVYGSDKDMEASASFNDSLAASVIGVNIDMRAYANNATGQNNYVVMEYKITNQSASTYDSLFVGFFADWDINDAMYNRGDWDNTTSTLYTYDVQGAGKYAGISLLSGQKPSCFSLDNAAPSSGGNINPNDDFTSLEKYTTLANGVLRPQAGYTGFGTDVSQVIGARILNLAPGQSATVAYAIIGGDNLAAMLASADAAHEYFRSIKTGPLPVLANQTICNADTVDITLNPSNGSQFTFFADEELTQELGTGNSLVLNDVSAADTVFVVNSDSLFDSEAIMFRVIEDAMVSNFQMFPADTLRLDDGTTVFTNNLTQASISSTWTDGQGNTFTSASPTLTYTVAGTYVVTLRSSSASGCLDSAFKVLVVKDFSPVAPTITFTSPNTGVYDDSHTLTVTSNSAGAISFSVVNGTGSATILGSTITFTGAGTVTVTADQVADAGFTSGSQTQVITISKAVPVIAFTSSNSGVYGSTSTLSVNSTSGGAISYFVSNGTGMASVAGTTLTPVKAGTVTIMASQAADANHFASSELQTFTIQKAVPSLSITSSNTGEEGDVIELMANSNSNGNLSYSVTNNTGVASLIGNNLNLQTEGTVIVTANLDEDENYEATSVDQTVTISPLNSIADKINQSLVLFPNPAADHVSLECVPCNLTGASVELVNELGVSVYSDYQVQTQEIIPMENLPQGIYYLKVYINEEQVIRKIVKE